MRLSSSAQHILANLIIGIALILFIIPLVQTVFTAVKDNAEIYQVPITILPQNVTDAHFVHVFTKLSKDFFSFFKNSVVVTTSSVFLIVGFGSLAAFGLSRIDFIGKRFIIFFMSLVLAHSSDYYGDSDFYDGNRLTHQEHEHRLDSAVCRRLYAVAIVHSV